MRKKLKIIRVHYLQLQHLVTDQVWIYKCKYISIYTVMEICAELSITVNVKYNNKYKSRTMRNEKDDKMNLTSHDL